MIAVPHEVAACVHSWVTAIEDDHEGIMVAAICDVPAEDWPDDMLGRLVVTPTGIFAPCWWPSLSHPHESVLRSLQRPCPFRRVIGANDERPRVS